MSPAAAARAPRFLLARQIASAPERKRVRSLIREDQRTLQDVSKAGGPLGGESSAERCGRLGSLTR